MKGNFSDSQKNLAFELIKNNFQIKKYDQKNTLVLSNGNTKIKFLTPLKLRK